MSNAFWLIGIMKLLKSVLGRMSHNYPGKDYIYLFDRIGTTLLKNLFTEISNFQLKAERIENTIVQALHRSRI